MDKGYYNEDIIEAPFAEDIVAIHNKNGQGLLH